MRVFRSLFLLSRIGYTFSAPNFYSLQASGEFLGLHRQLLQNQAMHEQHLRQYCRRWCWWQWWQESMYSTPRKNNYFIISKLFTVSHQFTAPVCQRLHPLHITCLMFIFLKKDFKIFYSQLQCFLHICTSQLHDRGKCFRDCFAVLSLYDNIVS